jgi:hypothetical protein
VKIRLLTVSILLSTACAAHLPAVIHRVGAASRPSPTPTSQTVGSWLVDGANSTGCASDANTCQSATCAGSLIGPCKSAGEILSRWATSAPTTAQPTRVRFLSDDNESPFDLTPIVAQGGKFIVQGGLMLVSSGAIGAVVAKNRPSGQLLTVNLGQPSAPFVGLMLANITRGSHAWIDPGGVGNVAIVTAPQSPITDCTGGAALHDDTQTGDLYQILQPVKVPLRTFNPSFETGASDGIGFGVTCVEDIWVPDASGTPGTNAFSYNISSPINGSRVDPNSFVRINNQRQEPDYSFDSYFNGGLQANGSTQNAPGIIGGAIYSSESSGGANNGGFILDGDVVTHGLVLMANGPGFIGSAYVKFRLLIFGSTVRLGANISPSPAIWGPGLLKVGPNTTLIFEATTATASLLQIGGSFFGDSSSIGTGCALDISVDPSTWRCGRTLTPAHIDGTVASGGFGGSAGDPFLNSWITVER